MPTKQCGHTDDKEGDDCSLCKTITKTLSKDSPPKILKKILSVRTFAVFIFYHGSECNGCNAYFDALATHVKDFRTMGGDVFAVTTLERKEALHTERLWHSSIGVISDPKIVLAKKFAITVPKTKVHHGLQAKKSFFQKLKLATSKDSQPPYSSSFSGDEGMVTHREQVSDSPDSQPTFLIVKNDEEVIYSWTGAQSPNAPLSVTDPNQIMKTRVTPQDLSSIVRFCKCYYFID
jgi:peroxiredoxin